MHDPYYYPPNSAIVIGSHPSRPLRVDLPLKNGPRAVAWLSFLSLSSTEVERPVMNAERPSVSGAAPPVSTLARRIHGWSWQAFPMGMGTGAVYVTLSGLEEHPGPLTKVEAVFFCINVLLFILNSSALFLQALLYPRQSRRLINDPVKGLFVPIIVLSFGTIIIGIIKYGAIPGHISPDGIYVLFWIYVFLSVFVCFLMLMIWYNKPHDVTAFTPSCAFPIFPMMFVGVLASNVLQVLEPSESRAVGVLFVGYFFQGIGSFMTMFYISIYILRIMTTGFLEGRQANGAFIACGPPGLTALALINLGSHARKILPQHSLVSPLSGEIWFSSSVLMGLPLFGLAVFFFIFGLLPYWLKVRRNLSEILGFWALTSPNVGWISSLRVLGSTLQIPGFLIVYTIMAVAMCVVWVVLFGLTVFAFWKGKILLAAEADVLRDGNRKTGDMTV